MRRLTINTLLAIAIGLAGCSSKKAVDSASTGTSANVAANSQPSGQPNVVQQPIAVPANASPDQVVTVFLNALRGGDSPTAESLLTARARQELAKHSLSVDVQSAPNASYHVRPAEVLTDQSGAHVKSVWTEKFDDGDETYEIVWALRHQQDGWRLAGMAMQLIPGQQMQYLNFEDPADMLRKKEEAIATLQRPAAETAQQPPPPTSNSAPQRIER
jgi:hypothetical protein